MRSAIAVQAMLGLRRAALGAHRILACRAEGRLRRRARPGPTRRHRLAAAARPSAARAMRRFRRFQGVERLGPACCDLRRRRLQIPHARPRLRPAVQPVRPPGGRHRRRAAPSRRAPPRSPCAARRAAACSRTSSFAFGPRRGIGRPGRGQRAARSLDGLAQSREIGQRPLRIVGQPERDPHVLALRRQTRRSACRWRPACVATSVACATQVLMRRGAHVPGAVPRPSVPRAPACSASVAARSVSLAASAARRARLPPHRAPRPGRVAAPTAGCAAAAGPRRRWACRPGSCSRPSARPRLRGIPASGQAPVPAAQPSPAVSSSTSPICDRARASAGGPCDQPVKRSRAGRQLGGRIERQQFPPMSRGVTVGSRGQLLAQRRAERGFQPGGHAERVHHRRPTLAVLHREDFASARASAASRAATEFGGRLTLARGGQRRPGCGTGLLGGRKGVARRRSERLRLPSARSAGGIERARIHGLRRNLVPLRGAPGRIVGPIGSNAVRPRPADVRPSGRGRSPPPRPRWRGWPRPRPREPSPPLPSPPPRPPRRAGRVRNRLRPKRHPRRQVERRLPQNRG